MGQYGVYRRTPKVKDPHRAEICIKTLLNDENNMNMDDAKLKSAIERNLVEMN